MKKTFTLLTAVLFSVVANAQWDTLNTQTHTEFHSISFPDNMNGLAVGRNATSGRGAAYYTADAGQTWTAANINTNAPAINDVIFFSPYLGFAVSDSGQVFTCNVQGSVVVETFQLGAYNLNCICKASDTVAYIGGDNGVMYRSPDFGQTWNALNTHTTNSIRDIYFANELSGWFVADGGYIASTTDGGQTWTADTTNPYLGFLQCKSIAFAGTSMKAYVTGKNGLMVSSTDNGMSWGMTNMNTTNYLNCIRFSNDLSGVIVGSNGMIRRTWVGGPNFDDETMSYVTEHLTKVCYANDSTAYICGYNGRILKSNMDISSTHEIVAAGFTTTVFPNPFADELHFVIRLEERSAVNMIITDLTGRVVAEENSGEMNEGETILSPDISSLASGTYLATIITSGGRVSVPVVKQ
jgi:photosystem II stability/assembly factor-like uncharacterized protein